MLDITHSSIVRDYRNFYASTFDRNIPFTIPGRYNTNTRQFGKRNLGHDRYPLLLLALEFRKVY